MEQATINHIERNAVANTTAQIIATCDEPVAIVPDGYSIQQLEQFQLRPERFKGIFTTNSLTNFLKYANEQGEVVCMIEPEDMLAVAYFNLGYAEDPGHGDHRARLRLRPTAAYMKLQEIEGKALNQKLFAEWLQDWREYISATDEHGNELELKRAIQAVRDISINKLKTSDHQEQTFSSAKSSMERIDANAKEPLPYEIRFRCEPYQSLSPRTFSIRVSLITTGETPVFKLRFIQHEIELEAMATEFNDLIESGISVDGAELYVGSFHK